MKNNRTNLWTTDLETLKTKKAVRKSYFPGGIFICERALGLQF